MPPLIVTNHAAGLILFATYIAWLATEIIHTLKHRVDDTSKVNDRLSRFGIAISIYTGILVAYRLAYVEPNANIIWHPEVLFTFGIIMMLAGVAFRWYSVSVLGKYFSFQLAIQHGQTVVQNGPYRWIRHPSYTGSLMTLAGLGLVLGNWLSLVIVLMAGLVGFGYRVRVEERMLVAALGEPYREYMKHTKRFIPFLY